MGTMYLRGIREEVVRRAKATAAARGETLTAFVERTLEQQARREEPGRSRRSEIAPEIEWFDAHRQTLLPKYQGEYVAIVDQGVVDHDPDLNDLARRVAERFGTRSVFLPFCSEEPRTVRVRSPRVVR